MGFFSQLFGGSKSTDSNSRTAISRQGYARWVEPEVTWPEEEWARRLRAYGRRCARELTERGVPLWSSRRARDDAYRDAFWVVSVDVDAAERYYLEHDLTRSKGSVVKEGEFGGHIRGDALILSADGGVYSSRCEMWFPPKGHQSEGNLDSVFYAPTLEHLQNSPWAGLNTGHWRRVKDLIVYRVPVHTMRSEFKSRYPPGVWDGKDPGKGTSIALSKFLRSGETQWPKWFDEYYGR